MKSIFACFFLFSTSSPLKSMDYKNVYFRANVAKTLPFATLSSGKIHFKTFILKINFFDLPIFTKIYQFIFLDLPIPLGRERYISQQSVWIAKAFYPRNSAINTYNPSLYIFFQLLYCVRFSNLHILPKVIPQDIQGFSIWPPWQTDNNTNPKIYLPGNNGPNISIFFWTVTCSPILLEPYILQI